MVATTFNYWAQQWRSDVAAPGDDVKAIVDCRQRVVKFMGQRRDKFVLTPVSRSGFSIYDRAIAVDSKWLNVSINSISGSAKDGRDFRVKRKCANTLPAG